MLTRVPPPDDALQVTFWGVRGSVCASGRRFQEFGGHTPCVEFRLGGRLFVVDAGTGLSALGASLGQNAPAEIDLLLSHLHLDHITGLPFFKPALLSDRLLRIHCGNLDGASAREALDRIFAPPLFPVRLDQLPARIEHVGFRAGETLRFPDGHCVATCPLQHPSGATAYRFSHGGRTVAYVSDVEHEIGWPPAELGRFVEGVDLMIYDAMFSEQEYTACKGWGHSTWQAGVQLCREAGVGAMAIFHLHPGHDDEHMRRVEAAVQAEMPTAFVAREGQTLTFAPLAATVA